MMEKGVKDKTVVVVGAGVSGIAAANLCINKGAKEVRLVDINPSVLEKDRVRDLISKGVRVLTGEHTRDQFASSDLVILSPGVLKDKVEPFVPDGVGIVSELEVGFWFINSTVIAVTGTNGKTTTSSVIAHVLGKRFSVFLGGNIGTPLSSYVVEDKKADFLVLEVSSFQLQNIVHFRANVSLFLNFSPNHLDFHRTEEEYFLAKVNIFKNQTDRDIAIIEPSLVGKILDRIEVKPKILVFKGNKRFDSVPLLGEHNQKNLEAAWLCCSLFGICEQEFEESLKDFTPHPHRLEVFFEKDGVLFVDDSKATTLSATEAALSSFNRPVILLVGGRFKGGDPEKLKYILKQKVKELILFGESRDLFFSVWKGTCKIKVVPTLKEAAEECVKVCSSGDVVLLSPATSSFDEFSNYQERGRFFQRKIKELLCGK